MVLVAGGSLGAKKLYNAVLKARRQDLSLQENYVFVFINGRRLVDPSLVDEGVIVTDLITDQAIMGRLYRRADCAIVRGGTTTLAECKLFGLPLIIVPLPVTHDQSLNADYYVQHYGDIKLCQNDVKFVNHIVQSIAQLPPKITNLDERKIHENIAKAKNVILDILLTVHSN